MGTVKTKITDRFWKRYRELVRTEMIPYQWDVLNDNADINIEKERNDDFIPSEKSHAMENFRIAAGISEGEHYGWVFQDSDVYKWLESVAYSLAEKDDEDLRKIADSVIELISKAQEEDGYLNTYFTIMEPERRFKRLGESHELYCAGHFIEAAVAYYESTGNELALSVAKKLADCIDRNFGPEEGKIRGYDGHEEIEIGLMRLYHLTGEERYLALAKFFLDERGKDPLFFKKQNEKDGGRPLIAGMDKFPLYYFQNHAEIRKQDTAEGHAVRLVYMCTALADLACETGDAELYETCKKIWNNITKKRMYITGGIGSTVIGEAFTLDYDLPNDTMYCETCASIGLVFFARNMLRNEARGEYADIMERALYNTAIAGMALDGRHFFYVNPLEVVPAKYKKDPTKSHVKPVRPQWLGCACCPPNLARLVTSLEKYIYTETKDGKVLVNLYVQSESDLSWGSIAQKTSYPQDGVVEITIRNDSEAEKNIGLRLPGWSDDTVISVDGTKINHADTDGFAYISVKKGETRISIEFDMSVKEWYSNINVSENTGNVALSRGPFVYCMEEVDNGRNLHNLKLDTGSGYRLSWKEDELHGIYEINAKGQRLCSDSQELYERRPEKFYAEETTIKFIPYYAWANRGENEMRVWIKNSR
ncbi:hypothetical protein SAMN06296386_11746 [Lachnospiraceae bacterium]|nr:hypothetical protein SAMN06296386_11746 [Lachnospiraceae bacterium]